MINTTDNPVKPSTQDVLVGLCFAAVGALLPLTNYVIFDLKPSSKPHDSEMFCGQASWYFHESGKCATRLYPKGTKLKVWHGGKSVEVLVDDVGPSLLYYRQGRLIDLSREDFNKLAPPYLGLCLVQIQREP